MMLNALLISNLVLWVATAALVALCLALARQIGVLYERLMPVGALVIDKGPAVGSLAPMFELFDLRERPVKIGGLDEAGRGTLLFFLSPTCPICKKLLPLLPSIIANERQPYRVVLASDGERSEHSAFYRRAGLESAVNPVPYVLSQELGQTYQIGKLPYAVLLDEFGTVRAKGLVNTREHLESLFEAREQGVASIQEYSGKQRQSAAQAW
ncbi:methylamine dehydrogenase accessory protein MauD [Paraburkholderia acidicola]|uniref:Methylamine utilization protein MauD n=1 Tax=Paraburkholderia acidicola TaxID=1912599 RepID=A0A2A4EZR9_9BURK|nr:methylamine dehydrogenase accessory protein MauD [Paraburkholderia acidicola]PCE25942.1 methylamine dehydrogenase accessory protein MauD [Paraburkholderia acidicola]